MENKSSKNNKKGLLAVLILIAAVAVIGIIYVITRPSANEGDKHIVVEVIHADGNSKEFEYDTDEEYLRGVLEPAGLIAGEESSYGLYVKTVDGYTVDDSKMEWWCFTQNGEMLNTGVDTTPIADGDHFEITLTVGY